MVSTAGAASTQRITQRAYTTDNGTLSWEGSAGQLFSVTNNLTSGSIFSVNDVSGIPSIDVDADGTIQLAPYGSTEFVGIGSTQPTAKLDVAGNVAIGGSVYDNNDLPGTNGQILSNVTGFGVSWTDAPTGEVNVNEISSGSYYIGAFETTGTTAQAYIETTNPVVLTSDGNIGIGTTNATSTLTVVGDVNVSGLSTFRDYLRVNDNSSDSRLYVGSGPSSDQALLRHTNGFSYLYHYGNDTFHIALAAGSANKIQFDTISKKMCEMYRNGSVNLYYDGSEKFETRTDGIGVSGIVTAISGIVTYYGDGSGLTNLPASPSSNGEFYTGISSSVQISPLSFETSVFTFPSTAGKQYVIESINVANVDTSVGVGTTINIIASIEDSSGEKTYIAYNVPIVNGGLVDLLKNPIVAGPSDVIKMWTTNNSYIGVSNAAEVYMNYTEFTSTEYISEYASTVSIASTDRTSIYTSSTYPTTIESIHLTNRTDSGDYPVSITITNGVTTTYLAKDLILPRYSVVDILDRPKRIETNATIDIEVGSTSTIDVIIAGKQITS